MPQRPLRGTDCGRGVTLQSRAPPPADSPVSLARGLRVFQNIRAGTHSGHFPLLQPFRFTNGDTKAPRSRFILPNVHSWLETDEDEDFWLQTRVLSISPLTPVLLWLGDPAAWLRWWGVQ